MPIVSASSSDRTSIVDLLDAAGLPHDDLSDDLLSHFCVLRSQGAVRGVVGLEPIGRVALLRSLAVHPSTQEQGYGSALVQAAETQGRSQGVETLYLLTTTAASFFQKRGYDSISRDNVPPAIAQTNEFSQLCPDTATCMQKSLIS